MLYIFSESICPIFSGLGDSAGVLTGTSLKAAAANSWANFDLSRHKLSDKTGLTNIFKTEYQLNPMAQYWNNEEYYGFGLGASGYIDKIRYTNTKNLKDYLCKLLSIIASFSILKLFQIQNKKLLN